MTVAQLREKGGQVLLPGVHWVMMWQMDGFALERDIDE